METSLAQAQHVVAAVSSAQALQGAVQNLRLTDSKGVASTHQRDTLRAALQTCQQQADPCPFPYSRTDASGTQSSLRPLWSVQAGETVENVVGTRFEVQYSYPADGGTSGPSTVSVVDTWDCSDAGLMKVGRQAVQTFGDGTTAPWGEGDYQGVLYPREIAPGAQWDWTAAQWSGDPTTAEAWQTHVADVGRQTLTWPDGTFELIHLQLTEVTDTQTYTSDEYLVRRAS
jgi:hypothetical protein